MQVTGGAGLKKDPKYWSYSADQAESQENMD